MIPQFLFKDKWAVLAFNAYRQGMVLNERVVRSKNVLEGLQKEVNRTGKLGWFDGWMEWSSN